MKKAFTLIELLVVIAIIGILSTIVLASIQTARLKAKNSAIQATIVEFQKEAAIIYSDNNGFYQNTPSGTNTLIDCITEGNPFFESTEEFTLKIQELSGLDDNDDMYCYVDRDSYAVAFELPDTFNPALNNMKSYCFDSEGSWVVNNEDTADQISETSPYYCVN